MIHLLMVIVMKMMVKLSSKVERNNNLAVCKFFCFKLIFYITFLLNLFHHYLFSVDPSTKPQDEPKFLFFYSMLLGLFQMFCFKCKEGNPSVKIKRIGSMATVVQSCDTCGENFIWRSQPLMFKKNPMGNMLLSFSILMSGVSISKAFLMFRHLGLQAVVIDWHYSNPRGLT